jgi:hypothetical protein
LPVGGTLMLLAHRALRSGVERGRQFHHRTVGQPDLGVELGRHRRIAVLGDQGIETLLQQLAAVCDVGGPVEDLLLLLRPLQWPVGLLGGVRQSPVITRESTG